MNSTLKYSLVIAALLLTGTHVHAQEIPVKIDVDHASFAYGDDSSLVELYLGIEAASLRYNASDAGFMARLPLDLEINRSATATLADATQAAVWADSLVLTFSLPDTAGLGQGQHFIHQVRTTVPPGEYQLSLVIPETTQRPELELTRDLLVSDFDAADQPQLSDLTLASHITPSDDRSNPFYKNGLIVRPSANQLFGDGLTRLYYYAEAYQTEAVQTGGEYTLYAYVADANRPQPVANLETRQVREARSPDVLVGHFDTNELPSGSYFLRMVLLNENNEAVVEQARKFFVYNPGVEREQVAAVEVDFETSSYADMTEEEVEQGIEHAGIVANDMERRRMRQLSDAEIDTRRRYLMEFWRKRDDQPATPINEFKDEIYRRIQYANDRYASNVMEGWRSDRGRAVIKYGLPNNIEPHLYDRNSAPHEIWTYNNIPGEGQAMFVFADRTGFGNFELLHSTVTGERTLPNWRTELTGR